MKLAQWIEKENVTAQSRTVDFVLVTALEEERDAVLDRLPGHQQLSPFTEDIRTYFQANLPVIFPDGQTGVYRVVVMSLLRIGRVQAGIATVDAIRRWNPRYIVLIGIAGGIAGQGVSIGDILISDQIVDYSVQKLTPQGPQIRWEVQRADSRLLNACKNFRGESWQELIRTSRPDSAKPKRHTGPIASGDQVIAFGEVLTRYRGVWTELIGVEMEAAGVATAAFESSQKPGFFMVRCTSDLADEQKDSWDVKKWRPYACEAAASFAIAFLKSGPVPLSEGSENGLVKPGQLSLDRTDDYARVGKAGVSLVPHRKKISNEYIGDRHKFYEKALEKHSIINIWGRAGYGKTWVAAQIALQWEDEGFPFSPYVGPPRQAFWFKCDDSTGFQDIVLAIAEYLREQDIGELWHWVQGQTLDRSLPIAQTTRKLLMVLNQEQYLLCFDDVHRIHREQLQVQQLFDELEDKLDESKTRIILISRQRPYSKWKGHYLEALSEDHIQKLIIKLGLNYDKDWLTSDIATQFAFKLIGLVDCNLKLMEVLAFDWLRQNTTKADAQLYMQGLGRQSVAQAVFRQSDNHAVLLRILSVLDFPESQAILCELAHAQSMSKDDFVNTLGELVELRLVDGNERDEYYVHDTVRELCLKGLISGSEQLTYIHQQIGASFLKTMKSTGRGGKLCWQAFYHFAEAGDCASAIQVLIEYDLELVGIGKAEQVLKRIDQMITTLSRREQLDRMTDQQWLWMYIFRSRLNAWLGKLSEAKSIAEIGLDELKQIDNGQFEYEKAWLHARLGISLADMEDYGAAVRQLEESLESMRAYLGLGESIGERRLRRYELMRVLENLGYAYSLLGTREGHEKAFGYLEELVKLANAEAGAPKADYQKAKALVRFGYIYNRLGDYPLALKNLHESLRLFNELAHVWGISFVNCELGNTYFGLEDDVQAKQHYQLGLVKAREIGDGEIMLVAHINMGELHLVNGRIIESAQHFESAQRILEGKPEFAHSEESAKPIERPYLESFLDIYKMWLQGVKQIQEGQITQGADNIFTTLDELQERSATEDVVLVRRSLQRFTSEIQCQLADYREDICLIEKRISQHDVLGTKAPLQLVQEKQSLQQNIVRLEKLLRVMGNSDTLEQGQNEKTLTKGATSIT
ncbi:MAG: hypothetical protein GY832_26695 [Chloroflexi bacterium]|nr:hypothetical protein [Chloroflexota bacterium]